MIKFVKLLIPLLVAYSNFAYSQFNTITYTPSEKRYFKFKDNNSEMEKRYYNLAEIEDEKKEKKQNSNKKKWITTKKDLKNEIDSLKNMLKKLNPEKQKSFDYKKIEDSLMLIMLKKMNGFSQKTNTNPFKKMEFVNAPIENKLHMPLKNSLAITSGFGVRTHPIHGGKKMHNGIDFKAYYENVHSVLDGIVTEAGWDSNGGGKYIKIKHSNRFETAYLHLSEIYYAVGEPIKAGFVIAKSGNSGNSTGPHLHFSVKEYGRFINPLKFINDLVSANNLLATYYEQ